MMICRMTGSSKTLKNGLPERNCRGHMPLRADTGSGPGHASSMKNALQMVNKELMKNYDEQRSDALVQKYLDGPFIDHMVDKLMLPMFQKHATIDDLQYLTMKYRTNAGQVFQAHQAKMNTEGIGASIDDGLLNIAFHVNSFQTVFYDAMGNAVPYKSNGANFSEQQKAQMRGLARNKRFYVTDIHATGPFMWEPPPCP